MEVVSDSGLALYLALSFQCISAVGVLVTIYVSFHNKDKLETMAINIDGRMTNLLDTTRALATAQGNATGRADQTTEHAAAVSKVLDEATDRETAAHVAPAKMAVEGVVTTAVSGIAANLHVVKPGS